MRIPESWVDKHGNVSFYFERIEPAYFAEEKVGHSHLKLIYETPYSGFSYGCTPPDILKALEAVVPKVPDLPEIIAFRQPTRKQTQLRPVWGRFLYFANFGRHEGTAIVLESQEIGSELRWPRRMTLEDRAEFDRLRADGHEFSENKRSFKATLSIEGIRNTILYRTLLHELGHWVQYHNEVLNAPTALDSDRNVAERLHFSKPSSEREAFAHRFATELADHLRQSDIIPFEPNNFESG